MPRYDIRSSRERKLDLQQQRQQMDIQQQSADAQQQAAMFDRINALYGLSRDQQRDPFVLEQLKAQTEAERARTSGEQAMLPERIRQMQAGTRTAEVAATRDEQSLPEYLKGLTLQNEAQGIANQFSPREREMNLGIGQANRDAAAQALRRGELGIQSDAVVLSGLPERVAAEARARDIENRTKQTQLDYLPQVTQGQLGLTAAQVAQILTQNKALETKIPYLVPEMEAGIARDRAQAGLLDANTNATRVQSALGIAGSPDLTGVKGDVVWDMIEGTDPRSSIRRDRMGRRSAEQQMVLQDMDTQGYQFFMNPQKVSRAIELLGPDIVAARRQEVFSPKGPIDLQTAARDRVREKAFQY